MSLMPEKTAGIQGRKLRAIVLSLCLVPLAALVWSIWVWGWNFSRSLPDPALAGDLHPNGQIQIFDRNDRLVATVLGDEYRQPVPLSRVSAHMKDAVLAVEDRRFYRHHGIDLHGLARATLANIQAGRIVEGGSTITQQLAKNLYLKGEGRTVERKLQEMLLALKIERKYPKDRILESYLNQVYFGNGAYGIERAAYRYFNKSASALTLAESAFLASLISAPSVYGDPDNRAAALAKKRETLNRMAEYGFISDKQSITADKQPLKFQSGPSPLDRYPHYLSHTLTLVRRHLGDDRMSNQSLKIYTHLDPQAQQLAQAALDRGIKLAPRGVSQGAIVSMSVSDGSVLALVGGVGDFWRNQFNRATSPHTVGSAFKPFVYLAALIEGVLSPDSIVKDRPIRVDQPYSDVSYSPKNFDGRYLGILTVREAIALSRNVCAVQVGMDVGIDRVTETASLAGISARMEPYPSTALGACAVTPLEMATAYATLARGGTYIEPQVLRRIEAADGSIIAAFEPRPLKVFPTEQTAQLVDALQDVVAYGTGTRARLDGRPSAGKTGTADRSRDVWYIGFTPDIVTAVWGGNDKNRPIAAGHVTGGRIAAGIWKDYMEAYYQQHRVAPDAFDPPAYPLRRDRFHDDGGLLADAVEGLGDLLSGDADRNGRKRGSTMRAVKSVVRGIIGMFR